jgi:hypothetical protein
MTVVVVMSHGRHGLVGKSTFLFKQFVNSGDNLMVLAYSYLLTFGKVLFNVHTRTRSYLNCLYFLIFVLCCLPLLFVALRCLSLRFLALSCVV